MLRNLRPYQFFIYPDLCDICLQGLVFCLKSYYIRLKIGKSYKFVLKYTLFCDKFTQ